VPKNKPEIVTVPKLNYIAVRGKGNPNDEGGEYQRVIRWGMFEIKVGFNQVDKAAEELLSLKTKFETETKSSPEFLCVICGMTNMAFRRPDGVYVVPITALGI